MLQDHASPKFALILLCAVLPALAAAGAGPTSSGIDGLRAPPGFVIQVFHDGIGQRARHLVVRDNDDVFVARRDGALFALRDTDGDGQADLTEERALPISTGLEYQPPYLYFSDDATVSRIALDDALMPKAAPETMVSEFPEQMSHASKSLALNDRDELFVNVGAPSNACQTKTRSPGSPGLDPCPQLERQAAIWKFTASRPGQRQLDGERFVTGTRNVVGMAWNDAQSALYFVMHGRDQLSSLWAEHFDDSVSAEVPAEEFHLARPGADFGWPYTYVDPRTGKRLIAPEFGGDGVREAEPGKYETPLHAYPAHWAPNDLLFYSGTAFPAEYRGGAFIAWHGSWNRAPRPQEGYRVTFQPMRDGTVGGDPVDFLDGFKGMDALERPSDAHFRPSGLAQGPDGALYLSDSVKGRIWKISYRP